MSTTSARRVREDYPPSTAGTSWWRARRQRVAAGLLLLAGLALAPMVVAADPAEAPAAPVSQKTSTSQAQPAKPIVARDVDQNSGAFSRIGDATELSAFLVARSANEVDLAPLPTTTTTAAPTTTVAPPTTVAPAPAAPVAAPAPASGRCGGDLPPCWVMQRESGGNIHAQNPHSSASGKWQFIRSTWAGYGGYAEAHLAPESVQDAKARELWAGGSGCGHWSAC